VNLRTPSALIVAMLAAVMLACSFAAYATEPTDYRSAAEETRFRALVTTLRCVMCQNESLADSNALIAHDLRREILELMRAGKSDAQIRDYLVARYGEFVLYAPRVERTTWLLWFGPPLLLLIGLGTVVVVVRRRAARSDAPAPDSSNERSEDW
jgi:cytochrome c-type biogenesis protein CcmH